MKAGFSAALIIAAFVFLLPLTAFSEIKAGSIELNPFIGYHFFADSKNLKNESVYGGRIGYNFTRHFGIEGAMEVLKSRVADSTLTIGKEGEFRSPMDKVRINFYRIDAVYTLKPDGKFNPFIEAGLGIAHYNPTISTKDMGALNIGVGAKYWMSDNVALRFDVKDVVVTEFFQESFHNIIATVGLTFAFGGHGKFVPAPVAKVEAKPEPVIVAVTPEPEPVVVVTPPPKVEPVIIIVSEPKVEEKVAVIVAEPRIEEKVIILALEDIHFEFDKSTLTNDAQVILKRNVQILKDNPKAHYRIAGYTSASGTDEYNQKLSERRANAVKDYLVKEGLISTDRLVTIGFGETHPETYEVAPKDLYSPAAKSNMRVLFEISVK